MNDLDLGLMSLLNAQDAYVEAEQMYSGTADELFISKQMERRLARLGHGDLRLTVANVVVDAMADRMEISGISAGPNQAIVDEFAKVNKFDLTLKTAFRWALKYGDSYLIMEEDDDGDVLLFENKPYNVRVIYDHMNPRKKRFAIKRVEVDNPLGRKPLYRVNLYYADRVERYISKQGTRGVKSDDFEPFEGDKSVLKHGFDSLPVYHLRTSSDQQYGVPEHLNAYGPQQAINKMALTHIAAIEFQGFPLRWWSPGAALDTVAGASPDKFMTPKDEQATASLDEWGQAVRRELSQIKGDPANIIGLTAGAKVGQFEAADAKGFIDSMQFYIRHIALTTHTPIHAFDQHIDRAPSGEAIRVAEQPFISKLTDRSRLFGGALQDAIEDYLTFKDVEDIDVTVHWSPFQYMDTTDVWIAVQAEIEAGVPLYYALHRRGFTPQQLAQMGIDKSSMSPLLLSRIINNLRGMTGPAALVRNGQVAPESYTHIVEELNEQIDRGDDSVAA